MSNSNKRNSAGMPTSSGHFHPRLSMRAAASATISDDAINLIQQQQNMHLSQQTSNRNNPETQDLMENLPKYVGPDGLIREPVDLEGYVGLMQFENSPSRQILLLKIIVATLDHNPPISEKIIQCEGLMVLLGVWLSSIEQDKLLESIIVSKILEIFSRLSFTVDLLVKYKFGRIIKKITQQKGKLSKSATVIFNLATKLYDDWSTLASQSDMPSIPRRKSEESIQQEEKPEQVQEQVNDKQEIEMDAPIPEPAKRTIDYQEYFNEEGKRAKFAHVPRKKSVNFPDSPEELCKVIIFERAPEEYEYLSDGSASRDSYLHADKGEASMAFEQTRDMDVYSEPDYNLKPWKPLDKLEGIPEGRPEGIESEEKIIQRQRERSVLSVTYYSEADIPFSPSEVDVDHLVDDTESIKTIPIRPNEKIIKQNVPIRGPSLIIPQMFAPDIFNSFSGIYNNNLLNPFVPPEPTSPPYEPPRLTSSMPCSVTSPPYDPYWKGPDKYSKSSSSSANVTSPPYDPYWKGSDIYSRSSSSSSISSSSSSSSSSRDDRERDSYYSSRSICRHYRPGRPKSCWLGSDCKFIHQD